MSVLRAGIRAGGEPSHRRVGRACTKRPPKRFAAMATAPGRKAGPGRTGAGGETPRLEGHADCIRMAVRPSPGLCRNPLFCDIQTDRPEGIQRTIALIRECLAPHCSGAGKRRNLEGGNAMHRSKPDFIRLSLITIPIVATALLLNAFA